MLSRDAGVVVISCVSDNSLGKSPVLFTFQLHGCLGLVAASGFWTHFDNESHTPILPVTFLLIEYYYICGRKKVVYI